MNDLRNLLDFCVKYEHVILRPSSTLYRRGTLQSYKPAAFVHAFFVFNNAYSIDWQAALANPEIEPPDYHGQQSREHEQFWKMIEFCYERHPDPASVFAESLRSTLKRLSIRNPIEELQRINRAANSELERTLDNQYQRRQSQGKEISIRSIDDFRDSFQFIYEHTVRRDKKSPVQSRQPLPGFDEQIHINNLLYFVYKVRCNIFHGDKDIVGLSQSPTGQALENRLLIYAAILIAAVNLVLETVEQII